MTSTTWLITGSSRGFGRQWALAALDRGDSVAATARDTATLDDLVGRYGERVLPLALDVTDRGAAFAAVERAHEHFGRLDVLVNNAGYGQFGMVEELSETDLRQQMETNFFGAVWTTQAALPLMRAQGSGHVVQVTSEGGVLAFPDIAAYHASKWALEGFTQSLAQEVARFGIRVTLVEPTAYATDWGGSSARRAEPIAAYDEARAEMAAGFASRFGSLGDPAATRPAILRVVDAVDPPLRVFLGDGPLERASAEYEQRLDTWRTWEPVSVAAHGPA
jgi:NAD(P)-dependent dehydrogenase (short-subunit alcohol dehydrogenase family)